VADIREATEEDFEAVFQLLESRSRAAFGISDQTREFLEPRWARPSFGKWVAVESEEIAGYAGLDEDQELVHAAADPAIGDALLAHAEQAARERGFRHVSVTAVREDVPLYDAVRRNGYTLDRNVLRMWRMLDGELPQPVWAQGVTVRPYSPADAFGVHALLDAGYAGWDESYVARSHDGWLTFMTAHDDFDPMMWFLVERDGELVACALHWKESQARGWVKDLVVRTTERGRGLGKALLQHGFREYAKRGADRVGLKVDSTNPTGAVQLYERMGFVTDQQLGFWQKRL
jgi:ribosomal protein S18 acetylase RimI-like enzyme